MDRRLLLLLASLFLVTSLMAFKIDRVILGVDHHPNYLQFWPMVAKLWQERIGVRPTLALIGGDEVAVDETLGDVIRFAPIAGVPTWFQAQTIRLLLPILFPDEVCVTSDMDMLPISKAYFVDAVKDVPVDRFVVYNDKAYQNRFPICYLAAKGSIFKEVLRFDDSESFATIISRWFAYDLGWETDERVFYRYLTTWSDYANRCTKLGYGGESQRRICRSGWRYEQNKLNNYYYDAHLLRPYDKFKKEIDELVQKLCV